MSDRTTTVTDPVAGDGNGETSAAPLFFTLSTYNRFLRNWSLPSDHGSRSSSSSSSSPIVGSPAVVDSRPRDAISSKPSSNWFMSLASYHRFRRNLSPASSSHGTSDDHLSLLTTGDWESMEVLLASNLKSFTFPELRSATRKFRPDSFLGEGGFGYVYKGWIDEQTLTATKPGTGTAIAVKKLKPDGFQGHREWLAEVKYLGQFYHPNLVRLIGYCLEDEHRLLVYEFMPRGSLDNHLFRRGSYSQPLPWSLRMKVALGAAKGLAFLHTTDTNVIHRGFKASDVLLDSDFNAKLGDFGLAKDGPTGDKSHVSTRLMGTYGYAAPEYLATGHLTTKSDVYSFGVVLLEMLSGRRAIDKNRPSGEHNLVEWARPFLSNKRKIFRVLDTRLEGQYSLGGAQKAAALAVQCLSADSRCRPTMKDVVAALEQLQDTKDSTTRNVQPGQRVAAQRHSSAGQGARRRTMEEAGIRKLSHPRI